jgi:hypothetical protein
MEIMNLMNTDLKEEVLRDMYYKILEKSTFLTKNFSKGFILRLCNLLKEKTYSPE